MKTKAEVAPKRGMNPDVWDDLVIAFRKHPGLIQYAAKAAHVDWRTAARAWDGRGQRGKYGGGDGGYRPSYMPFPTIKEQLAAEANTAEKRQREHEEAEAARARDLAKQESDLRDKALAIEGGILSVGRSNVFQGLVALAQVTEGIAHLCRVINQKFMKIDPAKPDDLPVTIAEAFLILQRWQSTARGLIASADMLLQIERLRSNLPTTIVGFDVKHAKIEDAAREVDLASRALERARKLELVVSR